MKTVDKKQKYSLRETDKRLKRLARRMTGKCILNTVAQPCES